MLNQIGSILLEYAKCGILAWVMLIVGSWAKMLYLVFKNRPYESRVQTFSEVANKKHIKCKWYEVVMRIVIWPYGIVAGTKNAINAIRELEKELEEVHTC